jgi:hypothetical protein
MTERRRQRQLSKTAALAENPVLGLMRGKREGAMVSLKNKEKDPSSKGVCFLYSSDDAAIAANWVI